jgi:hypothetical protein
MTVNEKEVRRDMREEKKNPGRMNRKDLFWRNE